MPTSYNIIQPIYILLNVNLQVNILQVLLIKQIQKKAKQTKPRP
jgi:hypothetical protein